MNDTMKKSLSAPVALRDEELGEVAGGTLDYLDMSKYASQFQTSVTTIVGGPQIALSLGSVNSPQTQVQALSGSTTQVQTSAQ